MNYEHVIPVNYGPTQVNTGLSYLKLGQALALMGLPIEATIRVTQRQITDLIADENRPGHISYDDLRLFANGSSRPFCGFQFQIEDDLPITTGTLDIRTCIATCEDGPEITIFCDEDPGRPIFPFVFPNTNP